MRLFTFVVALLRTLGGFPYRKDETAPKTKTAYCVHRNMQNQVRLARLPVYRKSRLWVIWTSVVFVFLLVFGVAFAIKLYREEPSHFNVYTMGIADLVKNLVLLLSVTVFIIYLMLRKSMALELVSQLQILIDSEKTSRDARKNDSLKTAVLFLYLVCNFFSLGIFLSFYDLPFSVDELGEIFGIVMNVAIRGFTMAFYLAAVAILSDAYDEIAAKLSHLRRTYDVPVELQLPGINTTHHVAAPTSLATIDPLVLKDASTRLLHLHDLLTLLHRYMGFLITIVMLLSMIVSVLSFFYFSFWMRQSVAMKMFLITFLISTMLTLIVLCNTPLILERRVRHLQSLSRSLLRGEVNERTKEALNNLLGVLQEFPGFEICSLFTLGRARLVDICSFMATYFIILLQFRVSEDPCVS